MMTEHSNSISVPCVFPVRFIYYIFYNRFLNGRTDCASILGDRLV